MSAPRILPSRAAPAATVLPAPEGVSSARASGAGLSLCDVSGVGPRAAGCPAPEAAPVTRRAFGAGYFSGAAYFNADGDLVDVPPFARLVSVRFASFVISRGDLRALPPTEAAARAHARQEAAESTHNPESDVQGGGGNPAVPAQGADPP
ncbi:hypothetical protein [Mesorhizobium sp. CAU 1741]|uniref:hypothetical protein n=1 Tax=Mesorhizobium sp. CAU 1741 TaxID=3140366 RepID=UPI00325BFB20